MIDLELTIYIVTGVYGGTLVLLIIAVIVLFLKVGKFQKVAKMVALMTQSRGKRLQPQEELAKRYTMSTQVTDLERGSYHNNNNFAAKRPDILRPNGDFQDPSMMSHSKRTDEFYY